MKAKGWEGQFDEQKLSITTFRKRLDIAGPECEPAIVSFEKITDAVVEPRPSSQETAGRSRGQNLMTLMTGIDPATGVPVGDLERTKAGVHVIAERSLTLAPAAGPRADESSVPSAQEQLADDINAAMDAVLALPHLTGSAPNEVTVAGSALLRAASTVALGGASPSVAELVPAALRILEQVASAFAVGGTSVLRLAGPLGAILSAVWSSDIGHEQDFHVPESSLPSEAAPSTTGAKRNEQSGGGLTKPEVIDPKLKNLVNDLYKGLSGPNIKGTGSTADAIRNEKLTGEPTNGRYHTQKGAEYVKALERWLEKNRAASPSDRTIAEELLNDLRSALGGK